MIAIGFLSKSPFVHALGWTLLHFFWQGAMIALLLACILGALPSHASRMRYAASCAAMALIVALPLITFGILAAKSPHQTLHIVMPLSAENRTVLLTGELGASTEQWSVRCEQAVNQLLPFFIGFWLAGVIVLLCRLNLGLITTMKLSSIGAEPAAAELQKVLQTLRIRLGICRAIRFLHSTRVDAPTVVGWLRPAILIPLGCMTGLSEVQIEAIFAHELAHVRRHDYLIALFQSLIEALLFYHPAVWWISNRIRVEREHCCDDLAVAVCGDRLAYAKALSFLEERRSPTPAGAFGATGGVLKMRIARLLDLSQPPIFPRTAAAILVVLVAIAGFTIWGSARAQSTSSRREVTSNQSSSAKSQINSQDGVTPGGTTVQVRTLTIDSKDLPESDRIKIVQAYQGGTYPLEELVQRIRQNLRDRGYAKAIVELLQPASSPPGQQSQSMDISVRISAGAQYTLSGFSIEGAHALSRNQIVQQFPLRPGDLFSGTAIGKGLDRLKKLYGSNGYAGFGVIPRLQMDEVHHTVTLILDINEGKAAIADPQEDPILNLGGVTLLSDTQGADYGLYLAAWKKTTQATWEKLVPQEPKSLYLQKGVLIIRFKILPSGHIMDGSMVLEGRSGSTPLDSAAWEALTGSRYPPLPPEFLGPYLELRTVFSYNERPKL